MKALLIYPTCPSAQWSWKYALPMLSSKAAFPPLGLLTVASLLPGNWKKRLIDMNVHHLTDEDILWADYVFVSANSAQADSATAVLNRCKILGRRTVAGGPLYTTYGTGFEHIDHFLLGEAETTIPSFLRDMQEGMPHHVYTSAEKADLSNSPLPAWELIHMPDYAFMSVQYSSLHLPGEHSIPHTVVTPVCKSPVQVLNELDRLYTLGWRGNVLFTSNDGSAQPLPQMQELLPLLTDWMQRHRYPFAFYTLEALLLSPKTDTTQDMLKAGFRTAIFPSFQDSNEVEDIAALQPLLHSPRLLYQRIRTQLSSCRPLLASSPSHHVLSLTSLLRINWKLGVLQRDGIHYWSQLLRLLCTAPSLVADFELQAIIGYHMRKITKQTTKQQEIPHSSPKLATVTQ